MLSEPIPVVLVAGLLAALITPAIIFLAHRAELLDVPNERSSHSTVVPRGGGLAVIAAAFVTAAIAAGDDGDVLVLILGAGVLGVVGLVDDRHELPAPPRLAAQLVVPAVAALIAADRGGITLFLAVAVAVVWCAGYVNAFNFMDGINGISGTQAALTGVCLAIVARGVDADALELTSWAMVGASIGFLPFNAPRARVFLGDVGSYAMGFWLAATALLLWDAGASPLVLVGPFLLYLADTSIVLVRKWRRGESLFAAHREHAYQRLNRAGWSHTAVTTLCAVVTAATGGIMLITRDRGTGPQLVALAVSGLVVLAYLRFVATRCRTLVPVAA